MMAPTTRTLVVGLAAVVVLVVVWMNLLSGGMRRPGRAETEVVQGADLSVQSISTPHGSQGTRYSSTTSTAGSDTNVDDVPSWTAESHGRVDRTAAPADHRVGDGEVATLEPARAGGGGSMADAPDDISMKPLPQVPSIPRTAQELAYASYRLDLYRHKDGTTFPSTRLGKLTVAHVAKVMREASLSHLYTPGLTSIPKFALDMVLEDGHSGLPGARDRVRVYAKPGEASNGEHVFYESLCHAIDRVFGFYLVPPTTMTTIDLTATVHGLRQRACNEGDAEAAAAHDLGTMIDFIAHAPPFAKDLFHNGTTQYTVANVLVYPFELRPMDISYSVVPGRNGPVVESSVPEVFNEAISEYQLLYFFLHCHKKKHNIFVDVDRHTLLGIDNDRCPYRSRHLVVPSMMKTCRMRKELVERIEALATAGGDTVCLLIRHFLRNHDPMASRVLEALLDGGPSIMPLNLVRRKMFHSPSDPPGTCKLAGRVEEAMEAIEKCNARFARQNRIPLWTPSKSRMQLPSKVK